MAGTLQHRIVSWVSANWFDHVTYTVRNGLNRGLHRRGVSGWLGARFNRTHPESKRETPVNLWKGGLQDLRQRPKHNLPALDFLRSCAILLVITGHSANCPRWLSPFAYYGWTGVDLFFVLSGVLIGTQLWRELARTGHIRVGRFLLRRGLRIWPLYFSFVVFVAARVVLVGSNGSGLWADITYLSDYFPSRIAGGWSLSVEEQFYVLAPLSLVTFKRVLNPTRMWMIVVAPLLLLNLARFLQVRHSTLPEPALRQAMYFHIHTHADGLAVGMMLAWVAVMHPEWITSSAVRWSVAIAMFGAGVLVYRVDPIVTNFTALGLIYGSFALLGMAAARVPAPLNWHGFYVISRLSYGMYLNHFALIPLLPAHMSGWCKSGGEPIYWAYSAVLLLLSIGLASLTFLLIEWPFLRLRALWLAGKPKVAV